MLETPGARGGLELVKFHSPRCEAATGTPGEHRESAISIRSRRHRPPPCQRCRIAAVDSLAEVEKIPKTSIGSASSAGRRDHRSR